MNTAASTLLSERLAKFAVGTRLEEIPDAVIRRAQYLFLDAIGIAFASTQYEFAKRSLLAFAGISEGSSVVIGMEQTLSVRDAALMNGTLVHGLDYDDTYLPGSAHMSASAVPCTLAAAADRGSSGRELLAAAAVAMEATARLGAGANGNFQRAGFHPTGVVGIFGCALAIARLWNMTVEQAVLAQGVALSFASGSIKPASDGSWTKRIQPGAAASSAFVAAALARQGYTGPRECYEGTFGFFPTYLGEYARSADLSLVDKGLGETWEFIRATIKLYPACQQTHPFLNVAIALARQHRFEPADIARIKVRIAEQGVRLICEPLAEKKVPADFYAAQFSLPFQLGRALAYGKLGFDDFEPAALKDPVALGLAQKLEYEIDPDAGFPKYRSGEVIVTLRDGRELRGRNRLSPDEPASEAEIERKFISNVSTVASPSRAESLRDAILGLDKENDVRRFAKLLKGL